jgi:hypothetical protein
MSIQVRRISSERRERNGGSHRPLAILEPGAVEKLLASVYQDGSSAGNREHGGDVGRRLVGGVIVTRRTDDVGNPIGYLLRSSDSVARGQTRK